MHINDRKRLKIALMIPSVTIFFLWTVKLIEVQFEQPLFMWGIYPRTVDGLGGIVTMPFIHGDFKHLFQNTFPLFFLLFSLYYFYYKTATFVLLVGSLLTGICTWIIGSNNYHIGASGVIYMLATYLFLSGIFHRNIRLMAISFLVIFLYGGMIWGIFPLAAWEKAGISWEGHLAGGLTGLWLAIYHRKTKVNDEEFKVIQEQQMLDEEPFWLSSDQQEQNQEEQTKFKDLF